MERFLLFFLRETRAMPQSLTLESVLSAATLGFLWITGRSKISATNSAASYKYLRFSNTLFM